MELVEHRVELVPLVGPRLKSGSPVFPLSVISLRLALGLLEQ